MEKTYRCTAHGKPDRCFGSGPHSRQHRTFHERPDRPGRYARLRSATEAVRTLPEWFTGGGVRDLTRQEMDGVRGIPAALSLAQQAGWKRKAAIDRYLCDFAAMVT